MVIVARIKALREESAALLFLFAARFFSLVKGRRLVRIRTLNLAAQFGF